MSLRERARVLARSRSLRQHEVWVDQAILMWLSKQAGARLTPEQEVQSWIGEALCEVLP